MGTQSPNPSPILRVKVENFEIGPEVRGTGSAGALPVIASFVALEQQIILVNARSESV